MQASTDTTLKLLLIFLLAMLSMSMLSNYRNYQISKQYERFFGANILDPFNLTVYPKESNVGYTTTALGRRVIFYGDSRALEWPNPMYGDARWQFVNRGINAQTSVQVAGRFAHHIAPLDPDIVVIQVGVNDLRLIPLFPNQRASIIANTKQAIEQMVNDSVGAGAKVVLTTIFPVGKPNFEQKLMGESSQIITAVREVNQHILALANDQVTILNADPLLSNNGIVKPEYRNDFLHINQQGYHILNKELMRILTVLEGQHGDIQASR